MADPLPVLVLAAHGSASNSGNNPAARIADSLQKIPELADVQIGFLKEQPFLKDVLQSLAGQDTIIIPMTTGSGRVSDEIIPNLIREYGSPETMTLQDPVGNHPRIEKLMSERATDIMTSFDLLPVNTTLLIIGHGNPHNPSNARDTDKLANAIEIRTKIPASTAFIEQAPYISDWKENLSGTHVIVLPFLIGGGQHGGRDVPILLGLDPDKLEAEDGNPVSGPFEIDGRKLWCVRPVGQDPELADIIREIATRLTSATRVP